MTDEAVEPTVPHTEEQTDWIKSHKQDPEAVIGQAEGELAELGAKIEGHDIAPPSNPGAYIKQQIEFGEMVGAEINRNPIPTLSGSFLDMPEGHRCHCASCWGPVKPSQERLTPHHYSVAFGDAVLQVAKMIDGEWLSINDAVEVNVDDDYALRVSVPTHTCSNCWRGVCMFKDKGEFGVRLEKLA